MDLQKDIVAKLRVQEWHDNCIRKCAPIISAAQSIMEKKEERKTFTKAFTLDKQEFFEHRMTKIEDALIVEEAN